MTDAVELEIIYLTENCSLSTEGTASLVCKARAFPSQPTIIWIWNETSIGQTLTYSTFLDGSLSTISQIVVEAPGEYVCYAETRQSVQPHQGTVIVGPGNL